MVCSINSTRKAVNCTQLHLMQFISCLTHAIICYHINKSTISCQYMENNTTCYYSNKGELENTSRSVKKTLEVDLTQEISSQLQSGFTQV